MPKGELILRTRNTIVATANGGTGLYADCREMTPPFLSGEESLQSYYGWADAWERYGLSLEKGSLGKLMAYPPMKKPTNSKPTDRHGVAYLDSTIGFYDERLFSIDVHICAQTRSDYLDKYLLFRNEILGMQASEGRGQYIQLMTRHTGEVYHLLYEDCQPFSQYNMKKAYFTLSFIEPHPEIRDMRTPAILNAPTSL